jgi:hypothetical protein
MSALTLRVGQHTPNAFAQSWDWERVAPPTLKLAPPNADSLKKRMDLPPNFHPHVGIVSSTASISSSTTISTLGDYTTDIFGLGKFPIAGEENLRSLTDLKLGEFEAMDFEGLEPSEKKIQFDLTESARTVRHAIRFRAFNFIHCATLQTPTAKRTLTWMDFTASEFSHMGVPLSAMLQFSIPLVGSISSWPE